MIRYSLSEGRESSARPVHREIAVADEANDATGWLSLGADQATFEIRIVTNNGFRSETLVGGVVRDNVLHYVKDQDGTAITAEIAIETKQSHEDDDQAGTVQTVTGDSFIKTMNISEVADFVRCRIVSNPDNQLIYMGAAKRASS